MRLVLDTNVVMSGLLWRGTPYRLLQAIRGQHPSLQLYSSPVLLEELTEVIARPAFSQRLSSIGKTVREVLADYLEIVEVVEPLEIPRIVRDPDDDHVLACALTVDRSPCQIHDPFAESIKGAPARLGCSPPLDSMNHDSRIGFGAIPSGLSPAKYLFSCEVR
jgi:uncharacterized protein